MLEKGPDCTSLPLPDRVGRCGSDREAYELAPPNAVRRCKGSERGASVIFANPKEWTAALRKHGIAIVYHEIGKPPLRNLRDFRLFVPPAFFKAQLDALKELGAETKLQRDQTKDMPGKVILTFDDASAGVFRSALPALASVDFHGVIFVVVDAIGKNNSWDIGTHHAIRQSMNLEQIRAWARSGNAIGSHTNSHRRLTAIGKHDAWEEISGSKQRLEEMLGIEITQFAYPYGDYDERHAEMVERAGYREAYTTNVGLISDSASRYTIPRIPAWFAIRHRVSLLHSLLPSRIASQLAPISARDLCA